MEKIIKKWERILEQDLSKDVVYNRQVLIEMLNDFRSGVKLFIISDVKKSVGGFCRWCGNNSYTKRAGSILVCQRCDEDW